jgi:type IV pilus assembly protein PilC
MVLLVFMFIIVNVVLVYAIPRFVSFYEGMDAQLPLITRRLISVSGFLNDHLIFIIGGIALIYVTVKLVERWNREVVILDFLKYKIPFLGKILLENAVAVFSRTVSILISGGIPVPESISIAVGTFSNRYFHKKTKVIPDRVREGRLFSESLKEIKILPDLFWEIVRVGEDSGNLEEVLEKNADYFETSIDTKVNTIISLIEPVLIVFFGLLVAYMLLSIFIPIFNTARIAR